ncbi:hypothetical protein DFQ28_003018 [Apophysomyces sp. BC1034]|nr:hypothetical protein DFQ30_008383 [Apophysomyces sp. BC1015]KAG0179308.1 hypothetical protein DFQ29_002252 [Apophysomyces sp. BC1021]KAG0189738.1 hypothetical protein DFQ28_003018 [Apophysomyces sp. BC1034]
MTAATPIGDQHLDNDSTKSATAPVEGAKAPVSGPKELAAKHMQIIKNLEAEKDALTAEYAQMRKSSVSPETCKAQLKKITELTYQLNAFRKAMADRHNGVPGSDLHVTQKAPSAANATRSPSRVTLSDIPPFQLQGSHIWRPQDMVFPSVIQYLNRFEKIFRAYNADIEQEWEPWLDLAMPPHLDIWFSEEVKNRNYDWSTVRKIFIERFLPIEHRMDEYATRFQYAMLEGALDDNQGLGLRFLASLLPHVSENVRVDWVARHRSRLPRSLKEILKIATSVSSQKRYHNRKREEEREERPTPQKQRKKRYENSQCFYCGQKWGANYQ